MKIVPLGECLVLRRTEGETTSPGGIVLPETARAKPQEGRVLAVGDGRLLADGTRARPDVAEGDRVLFERYAGSEVQINGESLIIVRQHDVLAVVGA